MPGSPPTRWRLDGFDERYQEWLDQEHPDHSLGTLVLNWLFTRMEDPYEGVTRESGFPNLWWGGVPFSGHGDDQVVVVVYWVNESTHSLRCDRIASLTWPL